MLRHPFTHFLEDILARAFVARAVQNDFEDLKRTALVAAGEDFAQESQLFVS